MSKSQTSFVSQRLRTDFNHTWNLVFLIHFDVRAIVHRMYKHHHHFTSSRRSHVFFTFTKFKFPATFPVPQYPISSFCPTGGGVSRYVHSHLPCSCQTHLVSPGHDLIWLRLCSAGERKHAFTEIPPLPEYVSPTLLYLLSQLNEFQEILFFVISISRTLNHLNISFTLIWKREKRRRSFSSLMTSLSLFANHPTFLFHLGHYQAKIPDLVLTPHSLNTITVSPGFVLTTH